MPRIQEITLYQFDELSDSAKDSARQWFREVSADDMFWSECVTDDAAEVLSALGFDVSARRGHRGNAIYWSGFWSQGDGACFEGSFYASNRNPEKIAVLRDNRPASWIDSDGKEHACESNAELIRHMDELDAILAQRPTLSASLTHRGRYCHEHMVNIDVDASPDREDETHTTAEWDDLDAEDRAVAEQFEEVCRDLMRWIYRSLERENNYVNSDEQVDDTIRANEYEFLEDGARA